MIPFDECLPYVLAQEMEVPDDWSNPRNFSVDPVPTMCGIEQREYDHYRKFAGLHVRPVRKITLLEGAWIYENWYWLPYGNLLPSGLGLSFFDSAVNEGSTEAIRILQVALGVHNDGEWGPETAAAVGNTPPVAAVTAFHSRRVVVYRESKDFNIYGKDWLRRAEEIFQTSLTMVGK